MARARRRWSDLTAKVKKNSPPWVMMWMWPFVLMAPTPRTFSGTMAQTQAEAEAHEPSAS